MIKRIEVLKSENPYWGIQEGIGYHLSTTSKTADWNALQTRFPEGIHAKMASQNSFQTTGVSLHHRHKFPPPIFALQNPSTSPRILYQQKSEKEGEKNRPKITQLLSYFGLT